MKQESKANLLSHIEELENQLAEANQHLEAIKSGEVSAFVVNKNNQPEIFTLESVDYAYRILVENFSEGALNLSEEGMIIYTNNYFHELLGLAYDEVISNSIYDFIHPESLITFRELFNKSLTGQAKGEIILRAGKKNIPVYTSLTSLAPKLQSVGMIVTDLSQKKQLEKEIEIKKSLQNIFSRSPFTISLMEGEDFVFKIINAKAAEVIGRTESEILGKSVFELMPELQSQGFRDMLSNVVRTGERFIGNEVPATYTKNGKIISAYFDLTYEPYYNADGKITGVISSGIDVTEKVLARKKLEENHLKNAQLAAIVQSSEDAIISKTIEGIIASWNPGAKKLFGYTAEEMIGQSITKLIPSDRLFEEPEIISKIQRGQIIDHFETKRLTKYGKLIDISLTISPIKDPNGKVIGASKIARDITAAKITEEKIKQSEKQLRQITETIPQMVWVCNEKGEVIYFNKQWYSYTGTVEKDMMGHQWIKLVHPDDVNPTLEKWNYAQQTLTPVSIEYRLRSASGNYHWVLSKGSPILDTSGNLQKWFGACTFIDEQKEFLRLLEEEVATRTSELQKMNKELQSFAYISSHDLQEPLRKIQTFASRLLEKEHNNLSNNGKDMFNRLQSAASRMQTLINDLLAYSRTSTEERKFETVDLNKVIEEVKEDLREEIIDKHATLEARELCDAKIIPFQFRQLMHNLIGNALKFSNPKIAPHITIKSEHILKGTSTVLGGQPACHITIIDNGIGFEQQYSQKIFEVFQRLHGKNEYDGTGIGLAIVKKIIENHHGQITATSEPGKGARFDIYIPV